MSAAAPDDPSPDDPAPGDPAPGDPASGDPAPGDPEESGKGTYDALVAAHLTSVPEARLYVGDDLRRVHWAGVEAVFGALLAQLGRESILAVYDDSRFGRGRKGFVVTDEHLVYVQTDTQGVVRLADVRKASTIPAGEGVRLQVVRHGEGTQTVDVRVDEWDAIRAVHMWLRSVAAFNRSERGGGPHVVTATQALDRLEALLAQNRLRREHRERLKTLVARARQPGTKGRGGETGAT